MFEYVNTSVPNGLLPGTHGFCGVAMTRDLPEPIRRRLESFSSYTHLATANSPDYNRLNPVSWSHFVLDGGEHVLGCVRAAPFDYTGRTNRLARFWFFQPAEIPAGLNPTDAILQGGNSESLSDAWTGEPRWLAPRTSSPLAAVFTRSDVRPTAWMQTFGESDGPRLAAAFSVLLAERIRAKGRPLVFLADPATHGDGSLLLSLFADLIALLPAPLRGKSTFSTYPVALASSTVCHLRGEFGTETRLLAGETAWIDLRAGRAHGAETVAVPPELLFLATHGYEQPPEPVIRVRSSQPAPDARPTSSTSHSTPPHARGSGGANPPIGRLIHRTAVPKKKKTGFEDYLLWALLGALIGCVILCIFAFYILSAPMPVEQPPVRIVPKADTPKKDEPKTTSKPEEEKVSVAEPTIPTNEQVQQVEQNGEQEQPTPPTPPKPEELNPLLLAKQIKVVTVFDSKKIKNPEQCVWAYYEPGSHVISFHQVVKDGIGLKEPKKIDPVLLLLDKQEELLYWKWITAKRRLFESAQEVNLRELLFGPDASVFEVWQRLNPGKKESYDILAPSMGKLASDTHHPFSDYSGYSDSSISLTQLVNPYIEATQTELKNKEKDIQQIQNRITSLTKELENLRKSFDETTNSLASAQAELTTATEEYNSVSKKGNGNKNQQKKEEAEQKKNAAKARHDRLVKKKDDFEDKISNKENELENKKEERTKKQKELDTLSENRIERQNHLAKELRGVEFSVSIHIEK